MSISSRNRALDVARGFTVFIMPGVHSLLYYGDEKARHSRPGKVLGFLAEGPGAQLFMFLMGASVVLGKKKKPNRILKRSCLLFLQGFLLNVLRLVIPYKIGLVPEKLFEEAGIANDHRRIQALLLIGDILPCAAINYLIAALLYRRRYYVHWCMMLALVVAVYSPKIWDWHSPNPLVNYFLRLCTWKPPETFFPVLPWLTYTLAGVAWGHYLQNVPDRKLYSSTAIIGSLLMASGKIISKYEPARLKETYYRLGPGGTFEHLGVVLLWMCLCEAAVKQVRWNRFFSLLTYLSKHITKIYFIQWILVLWLLPLFGYRRSGLFRSLLSMMINTMLTLQANNLKMLRYGENL